MFSVKLVALFFIVSVAVSWMPGSVNTGVAEAVPRLNFNDKHIDQSINVSNDRSIGQMIIGRSSRVLAREGGSLDSDKHIDNMYPYYNTGGPIYVENHADVDRMVIRRHDDIYV
ncbi:uncharacterized protein LOC142981800 [Anticarsia gemmatalis]|uniref:uncharacterized protein LOC142981800 n=1 Tax=Anticarsia gemmatalis TaxID=129554 RepID=UPI003F767C4A